MPNYMTKGYDFPQVIRSVYDVDKNCLRVCVVDGSPGSGGGIEVIIDHTNDSIRLGDGTKLTTATLVGAKVGLDVNVINSPVGIVGDTDSVSMVVSGNEYSYALPVGTKQFEFRSRFRGKVIFGYTSGNRNFTVMPGTTKEITNINTTSIITLYVSSTKAGDTLEIQYWI